ncbi:hypothetical protein [Haladaptatus halobius]|uniref:hypothetical protein n=1 Tax=Haladaptatus halobius TaxID=2884875 RepID=UPI001D0ADAF0|nr:hypothetical protein [Haladaptatus halobius]
MIELEGEGITADGAAYLPLTTTKYVEAQGKTGSNLASRMPTTHIGRFKRRHARRVKVDARLG